MGQTERRLRAVRLCGVSGAASVIPSVRLKVCGGHRESFAESAVPVLVHFPAWHFRRESRDDKPLGLDDTGEEFQEPGSRTRRHSTMPRTGPVWFFDRHGRARHG